MKKEQIVSALYAFIAQRSGIEFGNYQSGDWKASREAFNGDYRPMLRHGKQARIMLHAIELRQSITAQNILDATRAYSGRLQIKEQDGKVQCEYTTGQYFPTEYRKAACAVLAQCLWDYFRSNMDPTLAKDIGEKFGVGHWIQKQARREFGRSIASTWFN